MQQEDRNRAGRKLLTAARIAARHLPDGLPPVLYLTDPSRTPDPAATVAQLPAGWGVVYRHFGHARITDTAIRITEAARKSHVRVLIANDPHLAAAVGADGVHWPFAHRHEAKRWRGRFALMTASAHSLKQLQQLQDTGVDAALLSTAFPSRSPSAGAPLGPVRFRAIARRATIAVYALGGLTAGTAAMLAPVAGIAAIDGIETVFGPRT